MPNTIRIKRRATGSGAGAPSGLANAELAYNEQTNILYYGWGTGGAGGTATQAIPIGGSGSYSFTDGSNAGGTWPISVTGNAGTVTNGVYTNRTITAGSGLVGGGDLSANRTFDIGQGDGITVSADAIAVDSSVVRTTGTQTINGSKTFGNTITFSSGLSVNSQKITNLATPTADTDAATKAYVDAARAGLDVKQSVRAASTRSFSSIFITTTRVGNVLSNTVNGTFPSTSVFDGVTLVVGDRILIKNESVDNGIYTITSLGGVGSVWSVTRAEDADTDSEVTAGMFVFVTEGTENADSGWVLTTNDTITLNTTALSFAQFSGAGQITAVSGLAKNGNNLGLATAYGDTVNPYGSKTQNTVLAAPTGSAGTPSFRALVAGDIPSLGNITNAGAIGSTANLPIITTTNGALTTGSFGTTANTFCQGNDSRLSDTRNTTNSLTVNNAGAGTSSPFTFNGSTAQTLSYNSIGAPSISGANAVGTWNIAITGNAGTVTNGVYTTGAQTINGAKTFGDQVTFGSGIVSSGTNSIQAAATASSATQFAVFTSSPASSAQSILTRTPAQVLSDIGAGTVTSVTAGSGMNFTNISSSGPVTLGTPSSITLSSTNSLTANSHTHAFAPGGTTSQYIRGDGVATSGGALSKTDDTNVTLTLGGSPTNSLLSAVSLTLGWTGNLAVGRGGTGQTTYTIGDLLYADTSSSLAKLAAVATGNVLISNGTGTAPSWSKVNLTSATHVSGTLPVTNGGTGQTSYVNGELLIGNTTGNTLTKATLTQGTGASITNGAGSITIGHGSTSTLSGSYGTAGISAITVDSFGHVTAVSTATYLTSATVCTAIADCTIDGGTF